MQQGDTLQQIADSARVSVNRSRWNSQPITDPDYIDVPQASW